MTEITYKCFYFFPCVIIWFRGRWRSSWWERSIVKCWAMRRHSATFMPLNWLNKAQFWRRELVCCSEKCAFSFPASITFINCNESKTHIPIKCFKDSDCSLELECMCLLCWFSGYLAVSLFLNESHELLLLLVNTVLKVGVTLLQHWHMPSEREHHMLKYFFFVAGSPEHKPYWGVHGSNCCQPNVP